MIHAVIPIQWISRELPKKEFREFHARPMFYWAISACLRSKKVGRVWISTHFDEAFDIIDTHFNGRLHRIKRPRELHGDVELLDVMKHAAGKIKEHTKTLKDTVIMQVQANKPLTMTRDIDSYIKKFKEGKYNSLFQIQRIRTAVNWEYKQSRRHGIENFKSCSIAKMWDYYSLINAEEGTWGFGKKHHDYMVGDHHIEIDSLEDFNIALALKKGGF